MTLDAEQIDNWNDGGLVELLWKDDKSNALTNAAAREIESLRAALDEANAGQVWQPIETAPKDGVILLYFSGRRWVNENGDEVSLPGNRKLAALAEVAFVEDGVIREAFTGHCVAEFEFQDRPTHWMPLPSPPKGTP